MRTRLLLAAIFLLPVLLLAQPASTDVFYLLKPARVFDGEQMHEGWQVLVKNGSIEAVGSTVTAPANTRVIVLKDCTLMPGLIEGHSHIFLHAYNETSWNDQVLKESRAERTARAVNHVRATLLAGFTTMRDLGTEGAMYDDAGIKHAIEKGVIPGPNMLVATRAIVLTGTYGPKSESADVDLPQGAAEVGNTDELLKEISKQISKGADVVKLYADYRWGRDGEARATFSAADLTRAVELARSGGRILAVHSSTAEGMRRSIAAGVTTIEHGDEGDATIFKSMKEKGIALCPTLAASDAIEQYKGWKKGIDPEPLRLQEKRKSFKAALAAGVTICMGGDVGVFPHGENVREMELMVDYGMPAIDVLRSATSVNADVFGISNKAGRIKPALPADITVAEGDPSKNISVLRKIRLVMKGGVIYKQ
ncbi:MAG TPA: amidohydrolase family protein [Chitinophagaceae bacterium]|jgi:imidazolonepropionase-like amidohydrolase